MSIISRFSQQMQGTTITWKKYQLITTYTESSTTLTSQAAVTLSSNYGFVDTGCFIPDGNVLTIDQNTGLYTPANYTQTNYTAGGTLRVFFWGGGVQLNRYFTVSNKTAWIGGSVPACLLAPIGAIKREIVKNESKGSYIEDVVAAQGTYPDNGVQDGYWYVKQ